jgi:hypothetical protein
VLNRKLSKNIYLEKDPFRSSHDVANKRYRLNICDDYHRHLCKRSRKSSCCRPCSSKYTFALPSVFNHKALKQMCLVSGWIQSMRYRGLSVPNVPSGT